MDKLQLAQQNLGQVFDSSIGCMDTMLSYWYEAKLSNLKLKTWPKLLLSSLSLDIPLPD